MRTGLTATFLLALVAALASGAQVAHAAGDSTLGLRLGSDHLSGGRADWEESALQFSHRFGKRHSLDLEVLRQTAIGFMPIVPSDQRRSARRGAWHRPA